jgi:sRNA-binding protein
MSETTSELTPAPVANPVAEPATESSVGESQAAPNGNAASGKKPQRAAVKMSDALPVLEALAGLYPHLFGVTFRPLKRGIFQDLMAAHPEVLQTSSLKDALSVHTRSTRYLQAVASGLARHDLSDAVVEAMAPEHVHHALMEVYRRRKGRAPLEEQRATLIKRLLQAFDASGLNVEDYRQRTLSNQPEINALTEEMLQLARAQAAKSEALVRTFGASGLSVEAFADMYGLQAADVARAIKSVRPA